MARARHSAIFVFLPIDIDDWLVVVVVVLVSARRRQAAMTVDRGQSSGQITVPVSRAMMHRRVPRPSGGCNILVHGLVNENDLHKTKVVC